MLKLKKTFSWGSMTAIALLLIPAVTWACPVTKPDLQLVKTGPSSVVPGSTAVFSIVVSNVGSTNVSNVTVKDFAPTGFVFNAASSSPECTASGSTVICTGFSLAKNDIKQLSVAFDIPATLACTGQTLVNRAIITLPATDSTPFNNQQQFAFQCGQPQPSATPTPTPEDKDEDKGEASLAISKDPDHSKTRPEHTFKYLITVWNDGNQDLHDVKVTDSLPDAVTPIEASNGGSISGNTVTWPNLALDSGEKKTMTITVKVKTNAKDQTLVNSVTAKSDDHDIEASDTDNDIKIERGADKVTPVAITPRQPQPVPVSAQAGLGLGAFSTLALSLGGFGAYRARKHWQ